MSNKKIPITEDELTQLLLLSDRAQVVTLDFGVAGTALRAIPENQWAFEALSELRGEKVQTA